MNYLEFFTTDNASGWKTREKLLSKNRPDIYEELTKFIKLHNLSDIEFKEQVWYFANGVTTKQKCLNCGSIKYSLKKL